MGSVFVPSIEAAVQEFVAKWQDRDESANFFQAYDAELVKDELRPIVFEEIRVQVRYGSRRVLSCVWWGFWGLWVVDELIIHETVTDVTVPSLHSMRTTSISVVHTIECTATRNTRAG